MKDIMKYKDFIASVHFSTEDEIFFGKIEGIEDLITFEGESVTLLKDAFKESVEEYLILCNQLGKKPHNPQNNPMHEPASPDAQVQEFR
jgi:predicted HicB family RNase H-like nuclease